MQKNPILWVFGKECDTLKMMVYRLYLLAVSANTSANKGGFDVKDTYRTKPAGIIASIVFKQNFTEGRFHIMKKAIQIFTLCLSLLSGVTLSAQAYYSSYLPDYYQIEKGSQLSIESNMPISVARVSQIDTVDKKQNTGSSTSVMQLKMLGFIPIKAVAVDEIDELSVALGGDNFGIKIFTSGVMVVGMTQVDSEQEAINPAKNAGIQTGDIILTINGQSVSSNEEVAKIIEDSNGEEMTFYMQREEKNFTVKFRALRSLTDQKYKAGLWVRDSSAGIGTMTFYNPVTGVYAGLGHAICDVDTGLVLPLSSGEIVGAQINSINKSSDGTTGELCGSFTSETLGDLQMNCELGVYGALLHPETSQNIVKIALKQEVHTGSAQIYTTVDNEAPRYYDCEIQKIVYHNTKTQNMVVKITDTELLEKTGGIVQGMSGSPIVQDGKLVAALTHVFVNDPQCGYAVFAENMYNQSLAVETKKAS